MHLFLRSIYALLLTTTCVVADDFTITVNSLGVGNAWSAGTVTPVHVSVTSSASEATAAWVQWEVLDADGDTVLWGKPITLAPNVTTSTWLYAPLRPWDSSTTEWTIRLREWDGKVPSLELARLQFTSTAIGSTRIDSSEGSIAIFGTRRLGLSGFQLFRPNDVKIEGTHLVSGLTSQDLPNAWPCLSGVDVIVWADAVPQFSFRQENAIEDWIKRGGHLVISLPTIGDPWNIGSVNGPLANVLSDVHTTVEEIPLGYLDEILGRNRGWPQFNITLRTFYLEDNDNARASSYPILTLRNNKIIGVQRTIGFGTVTILGVDLTSGQLSSLGLPETDILWNRILGRRSDTPSQNTITKLTEDSQLSLSIPTMTDLQLGNLAAQEIAMSTTAGGRLGTVFILVFVYFLISGPVGYLLLRHKHKQRWSWVAFASTAVAFSFITWGLASTTSSVKTPLKHFSIIDHVYGGDGQHVTGWCSIFLPTFGTSDIALAGEENNLLLPWTYPDAYFIPPFVDHREVIMNLDRVPNSFNQPSRATTANFSYDWLGGLDHPTYDSLIRATVNDEPTWVSGRNSNSVGSLTGSIVNNAKKTMRDVTIIWVTGIQNTIPQLGQFKDGTIAPWIQRTQSGQPLNKAYAWRMSSWPTGEEIDFSLFQPLPISTLGNAFEKRYQNDENISRNVLSSSPVESKNAWRMKMEMLSVYSHLRPPTYQKRPDSKQNTPTHQSTRYGGRFLDFAEWFGRPCIIVMGFIPNAPVPVPISVDGKQIEKSAGETFVRWVYPLGQLE